MNTLNDIKEIKKMWNNTSFLGRIFIAISTFLATSSIASLSQTIVEWKSFILDGIEFYRSYIIQPLIELLNSLGISIYAEAIDLYIVYIIGSTAMFRLFVVENNITGYINIIKHYLMGLVFFNFMYFVLYNYLTNLSTFNSDTSFSHAAFSTFIMLCAYPIVKKFNSKLKLEYYLPIIIPISLVLILAAINSGLTEPVK